MAHMARNQTNDRMTPPVEFGRSPSGSGGGRAERGRRTSKRKADVVLRIIKGESPDTLSRELGVSTGKLAEWRDEALAGMQSALMSRQADARDERIRDLQTKLGQQTMDMELLERKIEHLEDGLRPPSRRPKR